MSIFFDASEIFQFTIRIEENGEKFYRHAVRITEDDDTKEIFDFLADEEINFGVKRELDSILYYHEIKKICSKKSTQVNQ